MMSRWVSQLHDEDVSIVWSNVTRASLSYALPIIELYYVALYLYIQYYLYFIYIAVTKKGIDIFV